MSATVRPQPERPHLIRAECSECDWVGPLHDLDAPYRLLTRVVASADAHDHHCEAHR